MKAILTKELRACPTKPRRVKASEPDGLFIELTWRTDLTEEENHQRAAKALCEKHFWESGLLVMGWLKTYYNERYYAHCFRTPEFKIKKWQLPA